MVYFKIVPNVGFESGPLIRGYLSLKVIELAPRVEVPMGRPPLPEACKQGRFIGFKLKPDVAAALWAETECRETTPTELIRNILEDFVRQQCGRLEPGNEAA